MPGTALVARVLTAIALVVSVGCGGGTRSGIPGDVLEVGEPPTLGWPGETPCPGPLARVCAGRSIYLVATINAGTDALVICASDCPGPSDVSIFGFADGYALCRWPLTVQRACIRMGEMAERVSGQAAIYAIVND